MSADLRTTYMELANPSGKQWSGARDLNPGPHGPEVWAVSSTETGFKGFEVDWSLTRVYWARLEAIRGPGLLHELLHENGGLAAVSP
jgi:hypothetical protein